MVLALKARICIPIVWAAASTPLNVDSVVVELIGSTSTSIRAAFGKRSRRSSSRLVTTSPTMILIPVRLPSGFARLLTRPSFTDLRQRRIEQGWTWFPFLLPGPTGNHHPRRSLLPVAAPIQPLASGADRFDYRPSGIRRPRFRPQRNRLPSAPDGIHAGDKRQGMSC